MQCYMKLKINLSGKNLFFFLILYISKSKLIILGISPGIAIQLPFFHPCEQLRELKIIDCISTHILIPKVKVQFLNNLIK